MDSDDLIDDEDRKLQDDLRGSLRVFCERRFLGVQSETRESFIFVLQGSFATATSGRTCGYGVRVVSPDGTFEEVGFGVDDFWSHAFALRGALLYTIDYAQSHGYELYIEGADGSWEEYCSDVDELLSLPRYP